jgi:hypothetical protein
MQVTKAVGPFKVGGGGGLSGGGQGTETPVMKGVWGLPRIMKTFLFPGIHVFGGDTLSN